MINRVIKPRLRTHIISLGSIVLVVILLPLLRPGYILTTDMAWGPVIPEQSISNNIYLLFEILGAFSVVINGQYIQKMIIILIFFLSLLGIHYLAKSSELTFRLRYATLMASSLYMINPWSYSRLMMGQWLILLGYALLPWVVLSLRVLLQRPSFRNAAVFNACLLALGFTSIHVIGIALVACIVLLAVTIIQNRSMQEIQIRYFALATSVWLALNAVWLIPLLSGGSNIFLTVGSFNNSQLQAFASVGTIAGSVPLSTLLLEGFWADALGRYVLPSSLGWWWYFVAAAILSLVAVGVYRIFKLKDTLGISLVILGFIGWWLAMGVGSSWSAGTTNFLVDHVPFYRGYREPHKWLMLLALLYSYAAAIGLGYIADKIKNTNIRQYVIGGALLLPLLYTPTLLWGAGGQLKSAPYPSDYAIVAQKLDRAGKDIDVLVFPWHQYLPLSYAGRTVANPAGHYFQQDMITGDNPEIFGVPPQGQGDIYKLINGQVLPQSRERNDLVQQLKPYNIRYIMLLKEADWKEYGWLNQQKDLEKVHDSQTIRLYKVK